MKRLVSLLLALVMLACITSFAAAEEQPVLTFATDWSGGMDCVVATDSMYMKVWMEKTGIKVEAVTATNEQLSVSPVKPDIIRVQNIANCMGSDVYTMIANGELIALNQYIEDGLCPNYVAAIEEAGDGFRYVSNGDGVIPGFMQIREKNSPRSFAGIIVRQDWLTELGLDMPETIEDWDIALRAMKEAKGATFSGMWATIDAMEQGFVVRDDFYRDGTTVKFGPIEDNYEIFLDQMHTWYVDGILDPDFFTQSGDALFAKIANNETSAVIGWTGSTINKIMTMSEEVQNGIAPAPQPMFSKDNPSRVAYDIPSASGEWCYVISADCKYPELAVQFCDWVYSEEGKLLGTFGVEGESFEYDENGNPYYTEIITNNPKGYSLTEAKTYYVGEDNKPGVVMTASMMATYAYDVQKESLSVWNDPDNPIRWLPPLNFTAEENNELSLIMSDVNTYVSENKLNFIYGNRPMDEFEAFRSDILDMKIERAIEIYQAAYDRLLAK